MKFFWLIESVQGGPWYYSGNDSPPVCDVNFAFQYDTKEEAEEVLTEFENNHLWKVLEHGVGDAPKAPHPASPKPQSSAWPTRSDWFGIGMKQNFPGVDAEVLGVPGKRVDLEQWMKAYDILTKLQADQSLRDGEGE